MLGWWVAYVTTNGVPWIPSEPVTWAAGAGQGVLVLIDDAPAPLSVSFTQTAGPDPIVGDIIHGVTSGAERTVSAFRTTPVGEQIYPQRLPTFGGALTEIEWKTDLVKWRSHDTPIGVALVPFSTFRFALVYIGVGGTFFGCFQNLISRAAPDLVSATGSGGATTRGRSFPWSAQLAGYWNLTTSTTNGIAFQANEFVTWSSGAGRGRIVSYDDALHTLVLIYVGGEQPEVGDIIDGNVTNAQRTLSAFGANTPPPEDGLELLADPVAAPRWYRNYFNGDGLGIVWVNAQNRDDFPVPCTIQWRATLAGFVTNPVGQFRQNLAGEWIQMVGTFAMWKIQTEISGGMSDVGIYYLPASLADEISPTLPMNMHQEYFTQYPTLSQGTLLDSPVDVKYYDMRVFDGTSHYDLTEWKIVFSHLTPDVDHGWSVELPGKLSLVAGNGASYLAQENVSGRYVLSGLTYQRGDTFADLIFHDVVNVTEGTLVYNGPLWSATGALSPPFVQQDADRGFYLMNPSGASTPACCVHIASEAGTYTFTGDFARANDSSGSGDGSDVSVVSSGATLFSAHVTDVATVDADDIWNNASLTHFSVVKTLAVGDVTRFIVTGTAAGFDTTAFRVSWYFTSGAWPVKTPVRKGDSLYVREGMIVKNSTSDSSGVILERRGGRIGTHGLRHQVFFFDDADDAEIWNTIPNGTLATAIGQSESDVSADVNVFMNTGNQAEVSSITSSKKLWLHTWGRGSRRASVTGVNTPQASSGTLGYLPRGTGVFTNDPTSSSDNLSNGRIVGFGRYRHKIYGFSNIRNGDTYVGQAGIVATAFQMASGLTPFVKTRIIARTSRTTTIQIVSSSTDGSFDGWIHTWSST
jgi:hypothetical protein